MNKHNIPAAPDKHRMEELLGRIQPVPSQHFHAKMKQAAWRVEEAREPGAKNLRLKVTFAVIALALIITLFATPQGRAWAQEVFQFFDRINSTTVELPESQLKAMEAANKSYDLPLVPVFVPTVSPEMASLPGCETAQKSQSYRCRIALAESQLGFDLKELSVKPEGWIFDFVYFDPVSRTATISYTLDHRYQSYGSLYLAQGAGDFPRYYPNNPWEVVPADKVESVKVGNYDGEYVKGSFGAPAGSSLAWSDAYLHRLAWSDGTSWYLIQYWPNPNPPDKLNREQLIDLAEGLVDSPEEESEPADPDALYSTLYSISEAEEVSGFDLKAPTLLPLDIDFSYAHYYSYKNEVSLFYGINNELVIHQWPGKSLDLDKLSEPSNTNYKIVNVDGENAFYGSVDGSSGYLFLWWQKEGMNYQIYYYQYFGRTVDEEELIAVAESMQDIDDFRTKGRKPYEYVSIYEQALGFDAREFSEAPAGWEYGGVYADIQGPCITLFYKRVAEPGWLVINQCSTDQYFYVSDIPSDIIRYVQIGNERGIYAAGDFVTSDDGKLIWNPDLPLQKLYWQEGGLWMAMTTGQAGISKEELSAYSESLR